MFIYRYGHILSVGTRLGIFVNSFCMFVMYILNVPIGVLYTHNIYSYSYANICGNIVNNNDEIQWTNEHLLYKKYNLSQHFILERVDVSGVWEVSWRRGQTATYWPKVLLTIAQLLSHSGWAAQPWVTEGPKPSVYRWLSIRHLVPNWLQLQLTQVVCGTWLYNCQT